VSGDAGGTGKPAPQVFRFPVEAGHVMAFARALGDDDPGRVELGIHTPREPFVTPLTFPIAADVYDPECRRRPRPGADWVGTDAGLGESDGSGFHAEQHFEFHRHPIAGETLWVRRRPPGRTWEREGSRGGRLRFVETVTEYVDAADQPVVTARWISVRTERAVSG
jgi:hypothetical protein